MTQNFARVLLLGCCSGGAAVGAVPGERQWVLFQGCGGAVLGGPANLGGAPVPGVPGIVAASAFPWCCGAQCAWPFFVTPC